MKDHWKLFIALLFVAETARLEAQDTTTSTAGQPAAEALSLADAVRLADAHSPTVRVARAGVLRARGLELQARSELFPQVSGSAGYTRTLRSQFSALASGADTSEIAPPPGPCEDYLQDASASLSERVTGLELASRCAFGLNPFAGFGQVGFGAENQYQIGLSLSQSVFAGGRVRAQMASAGAVRETAEIQLTAERSQVALDAAAAYFDAALAARLSAIAELSLRQSEVTATQAQLAHEVGTTSEFEMLRARVARDNQRPIVIQRRAERDVAHLRLRQVLGISLDEPLSLSTTVEDTAAATAAVLAVVPSGRQIRRQALTRREIDERAPVREAAAGVDAQQAALNATRSQRLPQVSVTSQYGRVAFPLSGFPTNNEFRDNWTIGVGVQLPLFTGGRIRGEMMSARAGLEESRGRLEQARQLAELDARIQESALANAEATWLASAGTAEQAERAYQIAEVRYREGISTQLELDDARLLLEQAQVNRAVAARDLQLARVRLALLPDLPLQLERTGATRVPAPATNQLPTITSDPAAARQRSVSAPAPTSSTFGDITQ